MNNEQYHAHPAVGSSMLKEMMRSPAHYFARHLSPDRVATAPSTAMQFGTVVHAAILEPDTIGDVVAVMPDDAPDKRSAAGKAWHTAFAESARGRIIIGADDHARALTIANVVRADPTCAMLLADCDVEIPGFWNDGESGVACKFKPDAIKRDASMIIDLKTTKDASVDEFAKSIANFRYDISAAHYLEGALNTRDRLPHSFIFIAVEVEPPFALAVYRANPTVTMKGDSDRRRALERIAECAASNTWPGYDAGIWPIDLPKWARKVIE